MSAASSPAPAAGPVAFITEDPRNPTQYVINPAAAKLLKSIKGSSQYEQQHIS
jgi:hypothetical protein